MVKTLSSIGKGCSETLYSLHHWRFSRLDEVKLWATWSDLIVTLILSKRLALMTCWSHVPTWIILSSSDHRREKCVKCTCPWYFLLPLTMCADRSGSHSDMSNSMYWISSKYTLFRFVNYVFRLSFKQPANVLGVSHTKPLWSYSYTKNTGRNSK